jgi:hypothetical protein
MNSWIVPPGSTVSLKDLPTASKEGAPGDKRETEEALQETVQQISSYQERLWAEG